MAVLLLVLELLNACKVVNFLRGSGSVSLAGVEAGGAAAITGFSVGVLTIVGEEDGGGGVGFAGLCLLVDSGTTKLVLELVSVTSLLPAAGLAGAEGGGGAVGFVRAAGLEDFAAAAAAAAAAETITEAGVCVRFVAVGIGGICVGALGGGPAGPERCPGGVVKGGGGG